MKKLHRGGSNPDGEPLSAGRVEYLEAARQRVRRRRLRRTAILLAALILVTLFATGAVGASIARVKDLVDTVHIALSPAVGWPQQTGLGDLTAVQPMSGSFAAMDEDACVVYSLGGTRLAGIQSGYARPALAAGRNRFVLYNRSGNELRVESRTQNLYTKQMENSIFLCAVADNGNLAVVTEDISAMAKLLVYNANMEEVLRWSMSSNDGTPLRMAFSPDSRRLAAAAVTAGGGQMQTNLYVVTLAQGDPVNVGSQSGVPQWVGWLSGTTLLAVYDSRAILYNAAGGERARYEFGGGTLRDVSVDSAGNVALLLASGQVCQLVTLDKELNVQYSGNVTTSNKVVRRGELVYLLTDSTVESLTSAGEYQWSQSLTARPQALLADAKQALVFCGNTVQQVTAPETSQAS